MHRPTQFHYSIDIFPVVKYFFNTENDAPFICHCTNISVISSYWPTNKPENHLVIHKLYFSTRKQFGWLQGRHVRRTRWTSREVCDSACSLFWHVLKRNERNDLVVPLLVPQNWHKLSKFYIRVDNNGATCLCTGISYYSSQSKLNFCCIIQNDSQFLSDKRDRHSFLSTSSWWGLVTFSTMFFCVSNTRQHSHAHFLTLLLHKRNKLSEAQKRRGDITAVFHWSCTNPTLSSILLSRDPIELLPLSLARSSEGDKSKNK